MKTKLLVIPVFSFFTVLQVNAQWLQQTVAGVANYTGISCTDVNHCFVAGASGNVRKTVNGTTWTVSNSSTFTNLASIKMFDSTVSAWSGKVNGTMIHTANGGGTWTQVVPVTTTHVIYDYSFLNDTDYISVGGSSSNPLSGGQVIIRTSNAGANWAAQNISGVPALLGIECMGTTCISVGGAETIYRSTDSGNNWVKVDSGTTATYYDVHFPNTTTGYAVGGTVSTPTTGGIMKKTINGGLTWIPVVLPVTNTLYGVHFVNSDTGFVVGNGGTILNTTNGGISWTTQLSPVATDLTKIKLLNDSVGYICGSGGVVLKTINGGGYLTTGIHETSSIQNNVFVYESPSNHLVTIQTLFEMQHGEIRIVNELGQTMQLQKNIFGNNIAVNTSGLAKGVYFFRLNDEKVSASGKFMVD